MVLGAEVADPAQPYDPYGLLGGHWPTVSGEEFHHNSVEFAAHKAVYSESAGGMRANAGQVADAFLGASGGALANHLGVGESDLHGHGLQAEHASGVLSGVGEKIVDAKTYMAELVTTGTAEIDAAKPNARQGLIDSYQDQIAQVSTQLDSDLNAGADQIEAGATVQRGDAGAEAYVGTTPDGETSYSVRPDGSPTEWSRMPANTPKAELPPMSGQQSPPMPQTPASTMSNPGGSSSGAGAASGSSPASGMSGADAGGSSANPASSSSSGSSGTGQNDAGSGGDSGGNGGAGQSAGADLNQFFSPVPPMPNSPGAPITQLAQDTTPLPPAASSTAGQSAALPGNGTTPGKPGPNLGAMLGNPPAVAAMGSAQVGAPVSGGSSSGSSPTTATTGFNEKPVAATASGGSSARQASTTGIIPAPAPVPVESGEGKSERPNPLANLPAAHKLGHEVLAALVTGFRSARHPEQLAVAVVQRDEIRSTIYVSQDGLSVWPAKVKIPAGCLPLDRVTGVEDMDADVMHGLMGSTDLLAKLELLEPTEWTVEMVVTTDPELVNATVIHQDDEMWHRIFASGHTAPMSVSRGQLAQAGWEQAEDFAANLRLFWNLVDHPLDLRATTKSLRDARWATKQPENYHDTLAAWLLADALAALKKQTDESKQDAAYPLGALLHL